MKVRFLVERWSKQDAVEITKEEHDRLLKMNTDEREEYIKQNFPFLLEFKTVCVNVNIDKTSEDK